MTDPIRLDKRVSELMRCSRAQAQQYIDGGWVSIDGVVCEQPGTSVTSGQVTVAEDAQLNAIEPATIVWHKPAGFDATQSAGAITAANRSATDDSGVRLLQRHLHGLTALMPIDSDASGLVVLSQDGRIWRRLTEDYAAIEQEFVIEISGDPVPYGIARLCNGLQYQGRSLPPCKVSWQNEVRLRFAIKDVRPGQLRHMCEAVGLGVVWMRRIRVGRIPLGKLPVGEWRHLPAGARF
ncbi:rRNA pseudouridine synthase [Cognatiluteimonas profundi]|uniref:rRNA pseudouridine synthase n=1 Tax=Cognatiluteimonas profundi TaxID=2594501 RepID=UPI00131B5F0A|nr:rRNA pseudouridine synthase [Lysobacter profundi]